MWWVWIIQSSPLRKSDGNGQCVLDLPWSIEHSFLFCAIMYMSMHPILQMYFCRVHIGLKGWMTNEIYQEYKTCSKGMLYRKAIHVFEICLDSPWFIHGLHGHDRAALIMVISSWKTPIKLWKPKAALHYQKDFPYEKKPKKTNRLPGKNKELIECCDMILTSRGPSMSL